MSERDIFITALQIDEPAARSAYLDQACADDPALRPRVDMLLAAHARAGSFLEDPASGAAPPGGAATVNAAGEVAGSRIGPYKLLQQIGEGGMGVVWMAEQEEPLRRQVALKVIKPGMDSRQVLARFEAERQALALMDHPNIARVLDAGTTSGEPGGVRAGMPYFVMELVKGVPITRYCDDNQLTPRQRLELMVPVCQALQHAHQKGIIHRDIKPSNVLVASYDGRPVPKVIDFGVAKATGGQLTARTLFTGFGGLVGTLEYMAPEQAEFNALDIDTRSDVYSLGVLLYELLTGSTPLGGPRLQQAAVAEALRLIREEEPPPPSTRLSTEEALASISAQRRTEPAQLARQVRGELDWIVMKALDKDRNRRYASANDLARDLGRYLADEPVDASPPSAAYRLRKFARKHRTGLATGVLIALLLVVGAGVAKWQAWRAWQAEMQAREARDRAVAAEAQVRAGAANAEAMVEFMIDDLVSALREVRIGDNWQTDEGSRQIVRELLPRAQELARRFEGQPAVELSLRRLIGWGQYLLEDHPAAEQELRRVHTLVRAQHGATHHETVLALIGVAGILREQKQFTRAETLLLPELDNLLRVRDSETDPDTLDMVAELARVYRDQGRTEGYRLVATKLEESCRRRHEEPAAQAETLETLANRLLFGLFLELSREPERGQAEYNAHIRAIAEHVLRECVNLRRQTLPDDWKTYRAVAGLGRRLLWRKDYAGAETLLLEAHKGLKARESQAPAGVRDALRETVVSLVRLYEGWDRKEEAEQWRKQLQAA